MSAPVPAGASARDLLSAPVPAPVADDHLRGPEGAPLVTAYADYECPFCAVLHRQLEGVAVRVVFRHFPVRVRHPRAWPAACAAEAAGLQGRFWEMHDLLFGDQARLEDPHLWERARALELDLERFDAERRSAAVEARVRRDFDSGVRAGVVVTPTLFTSSGMYAGRLDAATVSSLAARPA